MFNNRLSAGPAGGNLVAGAWGWLQMRRKLLLSLVVAGGVLVAAPVIGFLTVRINPILVFVALAGPLALVGLQFILPRPELGPLLILFAAAFIPFSLPTGTESRLVDSFLLTLFFAGNWLVQMLVVNRRLSLQPSPVNKPLVGFMGVLVISTLWGNVFMDPLVNPANLSSKFIFVQVASALTMMMLPAAFLLVANHINRVQQLQIMAALMLLAGTLSAISWLGPVKLRFINSGGLFSMWVVGLSAGLALFIRKMPRTLRVFLMLLAAAWIYIRFGLGVSWLAGWLPSFIMLAILLAMRSKKLLLIALLAFTVYLTINSDYYLNTVIENETHESGDTRLAAWAVNWRVTGKHLLLGTGPAGYAAYYMSYFPDDAMATHNNVIDLLAQTGIVGLGLCLGFFGVLAWQGYRLRLRLKGRGDFAEALANIAFAGTVGCIVMMIFGDWLFPFTYTQTIAGFDYVVYSWLFMGAIVALNRLTRTGPGETQNA